MNSTLDDYRVKLVIAVCIVIIGGFIILSFIITPPTILAGERRVPARLPPISISHIVTAEYMAGLENYIADSFPFRENLRTLRAITTFYTLQQTDKDGLYFNRGGAGAFQKVNIEAYEKIADIILSIAEDLEDQSVYYTFIPDKSFYETRYYPGFDASLAEDVLSYRLGINNYTYIDLQSSVNTKSFYRTDLHWNQVEISEVLVELGKAMGFNIELESYTKEYAGDFIGGFGGQLALPIGNDNLYYLSNQNLSAYYLDELSMEFLPGLVYDHEKLNGIDPYDFFLSGIQPIVILDNKDNHSGRHLYVFRDSFTSSLAPLLASAYSKVYLIDLRCIDLWRLNQLVDFIPDSDVLFIYGTRSLNNPDSLLVSANSSR